MVRDNITVHISIYLSLGENKYTNKAVNKGDTDLQTDFSPKKKDEISCSSKIPKNIYTFAQENIGCKGGSSVV